MSSKMRPSFIIIGGVKCATSSLYRYLNTHPQILPCKTKEPQFWGKSWYRIIPSFGEYLALFPDKNTREPVEAEWLDLSVDERMVSSTFLKERVVEIDYITGEASANTWVTASPRLVKAFLPDVQLFMLIRNPTERYLSHFKMFQRFQQEGRVAYHDLSNLDTFVAKEIKDFQAGRQTKILHQGIYAKYLPKWKKHFAANLHLFPTKALSEEDSAISMLKKMADILKLDQTQYDTDFIKQRFNSAPITIQNHSVVEQLNDFYQPYNQQFEAIFGNFW